MGIDCLARLLLHSRDTSYLMAISLKDLRIIGLARTKAGLIASGFHWGNLAFPSGHFIVPYIMAACFEVEPTINLEGVFQYLMVILVHNRLLKHLHHSLLQAQSF